MQESLQLAFSFWNCHFPAVCPWASHYPLCLNFPFSEMGIIFVPPDSVDVGFTEINTYKAFSVEAAWFSLINVSFHY